MNLRRASGLLPAAVSAASLWLPWVDHRAAALVLTGLDLPEFVRFMGATSAHLVTATHMAFALPLIVAALTACLASGATRSSPWARAAVLVLALWLVSVAFSPLERRGEFLPVASLIAAVWLVAMVLRPSWRVTVAFSLGGGAMAPAAALWQYSRLLPSLSALYGGARWGSGAVLAAAVAVWGLGRVAAYAWFRLIVPALTARRAARG